jgi:5'-nucleotidase
MRILISNDDGIASPGLAALEEAALRLTDDVHVIAPEEKRTAASQSLTIAKPLTLTRRGPRRFSCSGTPADCVVAAMTWLFKDGPKPDLVLAGINDGRNVGEDVAYSGTLGIAREATFWGVPAIGLSRNKNPEVSPEDGPWLAGLIERLWTARSEWCVEGHFLAINLPKRLPAELRQAFVTRDKIASNAEVVAADGDVTTLVVPRGRPKTNLPGDENSLIDGGFATLTRFSVFGMTPLAPAFIARMTPKE